MRQEIIEYVIFEGAPSARDIAESLNCDYDDVIEELESLRDEGLIRNLSGEGPEDREWYSHDRRLCRVTVHWTFCGGPISQALSVVALDSEVSV